MKRDLHADNHWNIFNFSDNKKQMFIYIQVENSVYLQNASHPEFSVLSYN